MNITEIVKFGKCFELGAYLTNHLKYIKKNPKDNDVLQDVKNTLEHPDNKGDVFICANRHENIRLLIIEINQYIKQA